METHVSVKPSEESIAERIIHLHDVLNLGFRKISKQLREESISMNKDTNCRLYHKYKTSEDFEVGDEELDRFLELEEETR